MHDTLDEILHTAVELITGEPLGPRPGQAALAHDILQAFQDKAHTCAIAPTGSGKTLAALAPAFLVAVQNGERTVLSTESLSLQAQIRYKDAPMFADAVEKVTGLRPQLAVLKGFSNYVCKLALSEAVELPSDVVEWAESTQTGDRAEFAGDINGVWEHISVAPGDCIGAKKCPFGQECFPRMARQEAAEADVVVTNHHLLAIQASTSAPIVLGRDDLGDFHNLVVDEAHALPGIVRNSGAKEVSESRVRAVAAAIGGVYERPDLISDGQALGQLLTQELEGVHENTKLEGELITGSGPSIESWAKRCMNELGSISTGHGATALKINRVISRLDSLATDARAAHDPTPGFVRWVDEGKVKVAPVEVAAYIAGNLYRVPTEDGSRALGVAMISATIPPGFSREVGLSARTKEHPSPFDSAYERSLLYSPRITSDDELSRVATKRGTRWSFDTYRHPDWVAEQIIHLVRANRGRALVLSATRKGGELYAARLREALLFSGIRVHSQWDGQDTRHIIERWREDQSSVMVGTRSLMTGVDAAGQTCNLVIIDRIPRDPNNVVDDARVEVMMEAQGIDKWTAQRLVYGSEANLRLEQAAGRLIRSTSDSGVLAVLDPRLIAGTPLTYPRQTRDIYLRALRRFDNRTGLPRVVLDKLASQ